MHKQAVVCLGRQPEGDIFVFNAECILSLDGTPVANPPVLLPGKHASIGNAESTENKIICVLVITPPGGIYI